MAAWKEQRAICDIDQQKPCPVDPPGPCCMLPPRPLTPDEEAADAEQKKVIEAEIAAMNAAPVEPVKGKGKGKKGGK